MTFPEAITRILQNPQLIAVLAPKLVVVLNPSGRLVYANKPQVYCRFSAADVLAVVWETHYPEELMRMSDGETPSE
jgi:hypothetical protein